MESPAKLDEKGLVYITGLVALIFFAGYLKSYPIYSRYTLSTVKKMHDILDPYVILFWSISVPTIHELYYHNVKLYFHRIHHEDGNAHYSPELWDIDMNTRSKNIKLDNESLMVPILLGITGLMVSFINTKYDFIKYV